MEKFLKGFTFAWQGVSYAFRTQINFKVEVLSALVIITLSYYLNLNTSEWLWIAAAILLVLVTELVNTALETLVDLVSPEYNPKAGIVKDISAAVVLLTGVFAFIVGALILIPKIIDAS